MKSMLRALASWALVLVGCSASSPAVHQGASASPDVPAEAVEIEGLRSRLPVPAVGSLVRPGGKLFPSSALQSAPQPARFVEAGMEFGTGFEVVENPGSALKLAVRGGNLEVEVFVAREQLLPVLAEEVAQVFADGSGYVACPGLRVGFLEGRLVAAASGLSRLPLQLPESKIALGFDSVECSSLPALPRESQLACVAGQPLQGLPPPTEFTNPHSDCGVRDWAGELPPTLNGAPVDPSIAPLAWSATVHRHEDRLLVSTWIPESNADRARLQLRVVGRPSHVEDRSRGGALLRGPGRGPRVRSGAAVYFHDGTLAGRYVGSGITLEDEPASSSAQVAVGDSGKVCVVAPVEGGLCFSRADVESAEERKQESVVSLGNVSVGEGRTVSEVTSVVSQILPGVRSCHEKALRAGGPTSGEVLVALTISDEGRVASVSVENPLPEAEVAACIARIFERRRFPERLPPVLLGPPRTDVAVRVPLRLGVAVRKP